MLWIHELYTSLKTLLKFLQRLVEHETFSASKTKERIQHQSIGHVNHRSTVFSNLDKRAYDSGSNILFKWETKYEYGVYKDEHGYAQAPDGRIIHVSREDIIDILERTTMHGQAQTFLPKHEEKFTRTLPKLGSYSKADIDDTVHGIYRAHEMSLEESYRRLDDV